MLKHRQYRYFNILTRATLNETFTAKYDGVLPRTRQVRPKSEIYTPKRDDEHPHPFHMWSPPPPLPGFAPAIKYLHQNLLKNKSVVPSEQTSPFCFVNWQFYHVCNFKTIETSNLNENNNSFPGPFIIWTLEKQAPGKLSRSFEGWF